MLLRSTAWPCTAPLGRLVVPDVNMINAGASGSTAAARAASAVLSTAAPDAMTSSHDRVTVAPSPVRRREGPAGPLPSSTRSLTLGSWGRTSASMAA